MEFSVVIATYNRPNLLRAAIDSVLAQSIDDLECLVVDDGSHTASAVLPDDDRVRLIELAENRGLPVARNTGVAAARGDAVAFLDDDDLWTPDRLEHAREGLQRADVAVCRGRWMHEETSSPARPLEGQVHDVILDLFTPNLGRTAARREVVLDFDERYPASQDVEWWLRQTERSTVATVDRVGHLSRRHDGPRHSNGVQARIDAGLRLLTDHADYFATHPRARAFRQYRMGQLQAQLGQRAAARRSWRSSLRSQPSWRAARSLATAGPLAGRSPSEHTPS